jgi:hypothetical protein
MVEEDVAQMGPKDRIDPCPQKLDVGKGGEFTKVH